MVRAFGFTPGRKTISWSPSKEAGSTRFAVPCGTLTLTSPLLSEAKIAVYVPVPGTTQAESVTSIFGRSSSGVQSVPKEELAVSECVSPPCVTDHVTVSPIGIAETVKAAATLPAWNVTGWPRLPPGETSFAGPIGTVTGFGFPLS